MTAISRHLFGDQLTAFEIAVRCDEPNPYATLLKAAAKVVKGLDPGNVTLSGVHMNCDTDEFVIDLIVSKG